MKWMEKKDPENAPWEDPFSSDFPPPTMELFEMDDIVWRYMQWDPNTPWTHGRTSMRTTNEYRRVPEGGGWIIGGDPSADLCPSNFDDSPRIPFPEGVRFLDQGNSYVLEVSDVNVPPDEIEIVAIQNEMRAFFPLEFSRITAITRRPNKPAMKMLRITLEDEVLPKRAWADLWVDVLRINLPKDRTPYYDSLEEVPVHIIIREDPPPPLPHVPESVKHQPMIPELYVNEDHDYFDVVAKLHKRVQREFKFQGQRNLLTLSCISVSIIDDPRDPQGRGISIRKKTYTLEFPVPIDWSSTGNVIEGDTWHLWLNKAKVPPQP